MKQQGDVHASVDSVEKRLNRLRDEVNWYKMEKSSCRRNFWGK